MKKVTRQAKISPVSSAKNLKIEINQLIEKGLKKAIKRIDALEKKLEKLQSTKQKSIKNKVVKKVKSPLKGKMKKGRLSQKPMADNS